MATGVLEKRTAMATTAANTAKKVLVADRDPELRALIQALLTRHGFEVVLAQEGREALRKTLEVSPDAILLDTSLLANGALDVCGMLRANKETRDIPLAFLTSGAQPEAAKLAKQACVMLLIPKPFKVEQLVSSVGLLVSARRKKPAA